MGNFVHTHVFLRLVMSSFEIWKVKPCEKFVYSVLVINGVESHFTSCCYGNIIVAIDNTFMLPWIQYCSFTISIG